ncbi:MAG: leucine-rich repeat domain-containing protein [Cytophagales bacterium]|nr:leucine-rich repeat domain-containing protein [Cytophagales bacterium]
MDNRTPKIRNDIQDRNSLAWRKLCEYVEKVTTEGLDEFSPLEELGPELFCQICTLPEAIANLKKVKKMWLYGSKLKRIPPEIGKMESLEYFDPYTSYDLHWFPYEIMHCKNLKDSRVSTRVLYGNYKNRMMFPSLEQNPVRYLGHTVKCSICRKEMTYEQTIQLWISLWVGTDVLPLLANLCSEECTAQLPQPPKGYVRFAHKGGSELKQPTYQEWEAANGVKLTMEDIEKTQQNESEEKPKLLKVIRKIWDREK